MNDLSDRYAQLTTEQSNPHSLNLDRLSPLEFVDLMQREDFRVLEALDKVRDSLAELIGIVADHFRQGGRLFYAGAGTSGRLGMLDATECPPTFGVSRDQVQAILAGGFECLTHSVEGAEDDEHSGATAVAERGIRPVDVVLGIAASRTTPFVRGVLKAAREAGAYTAFLTCCATTVLHNSLSEVERELAEVRIIVLETGPEVLTGSTRLKAGTATKLFLNRLTTGAMLQLGKVYQNHMVDLYLTCNKLRERAIRTTRRFTGLEREEALTLLQAVGGSVKVAILVHQSGLSPVAAKQKLEACGGQLRIALGSE